MRVFWCKNCEVPVLNAESINEETVDENDYLDIEDEVIDWGLNNNFGEEYYNRFLSLKSNIKSMINSKTLEEIKNKIDETDVSFKSEHAIKKLKKFAKKYADIKFMNSSSEPSKKLKCPHCKNKTFYVGKDIRPVFMGERIVLSVLLEKDFKGENIWHASGSRYIIDGKTTDIKLKDIYNVDNLEKKKKLIREKIENCNKEVDFSKFIEVNNEHFRNIDNKAIDFIENGSEFFSERMEVVSFSGGKDSTVVSDLVRRALNDRDMLHIFGDTTLEFPYTYQYIKRLKDNSKPSKRRSFLSVDEPNKSFYELAEQFGPPSRVMSWCCNIFKTGPIGNLFKQIANESKLLTYYGVRRSESSSRSKYDKISQSPKIAKQLVISPIIDWHDAEVWLYLLTRGIDFNEAYKFGFRRVGCWCCPNNSDWSEFLSEIFMPNRSESWREFLIEFAKDIGKPDPEVYIDDGKWKARQGGQGLDIDNTMLESDTCGLGDKAKEYELSRAIDDSLYELFKPFGIIDKEIGNKMLGEVYILDPETNIPIIKLQGNKGSNKLKVVIPEESDIAYIKRIKQTNKEMESKTRTNILFQRVECQLRKYQLCEGCSACANVCPQDAISLKDGYTIDEEKCNHCMECVAHFHKGCLITKSTVDY